MISSTVCGEEEGGGDTCIRSVFFVRRVKLFSLEGSIMSSMYNASFWTSGAVGVSIWRTYFIHLKTLFP